MKRILLPTNFSRVAAQVYRLTAQIAKQNNASVVICNIVPCWSKGIETYHLAQAADYIQQADDAYLKTAHKHMAEVLDSAVFKGVQIEPEILVMSYHHWKNEFIEHTDSQAYDLVVIGHHEAGKEVLNFTDDLSQKMNTPVLACKHDDRLDTHRPLLVCTDFEHVNARFFKVMDSILPSPEVEKVIFYVNTKKEFLSDRDQLRHYHALVNKYHLKHTTFKTINADDVSKAISQEVNTQHYQAVAMATKGVTGVMKYLKRSITEEVFDQLPIPVISVNLHDYLEETAGQRNTTGFTG